MKPIIMEPVFREHPQQHSLSMGKLLNPIVESSIIVDKNFIQSNLFQLDPLLVFCSPCTTNQTGKGKNKIRFTLK